MQFMTARGSMDGLASAGYFSFGGLMCGCQQGLQSWNISTELHVQDGSFMGLEVEDSG